MKTIAILDQYRTGVQSSSGVQFETGPVPYINSQEEREREKKAVSKTACDARGQKSSKSDF